MLSLRAAIAAICALAAFAATDARADEPYYKGKRLTLLIGSAAGGPTDIEGRCSPNISAAISTVSPA